MPDSSSDLPSLNFAGTDSEDVTIFIRDVKRCAIAEGKQRDDEWIIDFVESCLSGVAMRWFTQLDEEWKASWKSLTRAIVDRFDAPVAPPPASAAAPPAPNTPSLRSSLPHFTRPVLPPSIPTAVRGAGTWWKVGNLVVAS